jgi:hypothetical protein
MFNNGFGLMKIIKKLLLILIILCFSRNLFSQEEEIWTEIILCNMPEGEWEGHAVSFLFSNVNGKDHESEINISMTFNYNKGDIYVFSIIKFDFNVFLTDLLDLEEIKEMGLQKHDVWIQFKEDLRNHLFLENDVFIEIENDIFLDKEYYALHMLVQYSLIIEREELAVEFFASDSEGTFLINSNKNKLLLTYFEPAFLLYIGDFGFTEMIFRKKP